MLPGIKNISPKLHDIKHPRRVVRKVYGEVPTPTRKPLSIRPFFLNMIIIVTLAGIGHAVYVSGIVTDVSDLVSIARDKGFFTSVDNKDTIALTADLLKEFPHLFGNINEVVGAVRGIGSGIDDLNKRGLALVLNGGGEEFLDILKRIHTNLGIFSRLGLDVPDRISPISFAGGGDVSEAFNNIDALYNGLGAIIGFFDVSDNRRIVLLFENHSEMRPTGGFIGSYGDLVITRGSIESIKIGDIYTPDRNAEYKIVPPVQLQGITTGWGARDANWFFDFPTSAEKVLELLEASELYVHDGTKFDGAIAINANVISDILEIIGPIDVPGYGVALDSENFLFAVRSEVEDARDEDPTENPKQILSVVAPIIIERLGNIDGDQKNRLVFDMLSRAFSKDIQLYFRDEELQNFVENTPFSGKVFELPEVFSGDYLAVVNSNIAGGKTDIFIEQSVVLDSEIVSDGTLRNNLTIVRRHIGENEEEPLYRTINQNYIKIFTLKDASLNFVDGITPKTVVPKIDYGEAGYSIDPILGALENTHEFLRGFNVDRYVESGKNVFGAWFTTLPGETNTLKLVYEEEGVIIHDGARFRFVSDRQSGVKSSFKYSVSAPSGYTWRETGKDIFKFNVDNLVSTRTTIDLTLSRNEPGSEN